MTPVEYPASTNISAIVYMFGLIIIAASPAAIPVPFFLHGYSPVSIPYLDGVLVDAPQWAFVNIIPSDASFSTFGVIIDFPP